MAPTKRPDPTAPRGPQLVDLTTNLPADDSDEWLKIYPLEGTEELPPASPVRPRATAAPRFAPPDAPGAVVPAAPPQVLTEALPAAPPPGTWLPWPQILGRLALLVGVVAAGTGLQLAVAWSGLLMRPHQWQTRPPAVRLIAAVPEGFAAAGDTEAAAPPAATPAPPAPASSSLAPPAAAPKPAPAHIALPVTPQPPADRGTAGTRGPSPPPAHGTTGAASPNVAALAVPRTGNTTRVSERPPEPDRTFATIPAPSITAAAPPPPTTPPVATLPAGRADAPATVTPPARSSAPPSSNPPAGTSGSGPGSTATVSTPPARAASPPPAPTSGAGASSSSSSVPPARETRPAEPAPAPAPADVQVRAVLERYRSAFDALDATAVQSVWPGVNARALQRAFSQLKEQQLAFATCDVVTGPRDAHASCTGTATYAQKIGNTDRRVEPRVWTFSLSRVGGAWVIDQVVSK